MFINSIQTKATSLKSYDTISLNSPYYKQIVPSAAWAWPHFPWVLPSWTQTSSTYLQPWVFIIQILKMRETNSIDSKCPHAHRQKIPVTGFQIDSEKWWCTAKVRAQHAPKTRQIVSDYLPNELVYNPCRVNAAKQRGTRNIYVDIFGFATTRANLSQPLTSRVTAL